MNWRLVKDILLKVLSMVLSYWIKPESPSQKAEKLAQEIERLNEEYENAQKKWAVAVATGKPDHIDLWNQWLLATKNLTRAECEYERLTGKRPDIH